MSGKKRVVNENVEVEVVAEATEKKGLFAQLVDGVKWTGNWCRRHWKGLAISAATIGAGLYLGAKIAEEDEEEVYLIEVETELEDIEDISEDDESEEDDDNEETEESNDEETED